MATAAVSGVEPSWLQSGNIGGGCRTPFEAAAAARNRHTPANAPLDATPAEGSGKTGQDALRYHQA